jgi:hypothetical protein
VWPSGPSGGTLPVQPPAMLVPVEDEPDKSSPTESGDAPEIEKQVSHLQGIFLSSLFAVSLTKLSKCWVCVCW